MKETTIDGVEYVLIPKNQETESWADDINNGTGILICELNGDKWYLGKEAPEEMDWSRATQWAAENDLILPPREILLMCYVNKNTRKFFKDYYYWTGTELDTSRAWIQYWYPTYPGYQGSFNKTIALRVRGVYKEKTVGAQ